MKLEYLESGSEDCPLIRIYAFSVQDIIELIDVLMAVMQGRIRKAQLDELLCVEQVQPCKISIETGLTNEGITRVSKEPIFKWVLSREGWASVIELLEPFSEGGTSNSYQWIAGKEACYGLNVGNISMLISDDEFGRW